MNETFLVQPPGTFATPSTSNGSWDWNGFTSGLFNLAGQGLQFGLGIAALNNGQPVPTTAAPGQTLVIDSSATQQPSSNSNTIIWVIVVAIVLIAILLGVYYFTKQSK